MLRAVLQAQEPADFDDAPKKGDVLRRRVKEGRFVGGKQFRGKRGKSWKPTVLCVLTHPGCSDPVEDDHITVHRFPCACLIKVGRLIRLYLVGGDVPKSQRLVAGDQLGDRSAAEDHDVPVVEPLSRVGCFVPVLFELGKVQFETPLFEPLGR